jgi:hypothetical protein
MTLLSRLPSTWCALQATQFGKIYSACLAAWLPVVPPPLKLGVPCAAELIAQEAGDMSSQQLLDLGAKVRWGVGGFASDWYSGCSTQIPTPQSSSTRCTLMRVAAAAHNGGLQSDTAKPSVSVTRRTRKRTCCRWTCCRRRCVTSASRRQSRGWRRIPDCCHVRCAAGSL